MCLSLIKFIDITPGSSAVPLEIYHAPIAAKPIIRNNNLHDTNSLVDDDVITCGKPVVVETVVVDRTLVELVKFEKLLLVGTSTELDITELDSTELDVTLSTLLDVELLEITDGVLLDVEDADVLLELVDMVVEV